MLWTSFRTRNTRSSCNIKESGREPQRPKHSHSRENHKNEKFSAEHHFPHSRGRRCVHPFPVPSPMNDSHAQGFHPRRSNEIHTFRHHHHSGQRSAGNISHHIGGYWKKTDPYREFISDDFEKLGTCAEILNIQLGFSKTEPWMGITHLLKSGKKIWCRAEGVQLRQDSVIGYMFSISNITEVVEARRT